MTEPNACPECGAALPANPPGGICPKCLMAAGLERTSESPVDRSRADRQAPTSASPPPCGFVPPDVGQLGGLFPQLEILELLGCGGMGAVYKARQTRLDRFVALKIIRPEAMHDRSFAERFHREAQTLARLSQRHIVAVHEFGEVNYTNAADAQGRP